MLADALLRIENWTFGCCFDERTDKREEDGREKGKWNGNDNIESALGCFEPGFFGFAKMLEKPGFADFCQRNASGQDLFEFFAIDEGDGGVQALIECFLKIRDLIHTHAERDSTDMVFLNAFAEIVHAIQPHDSICDQICSWRGMDNSHQLKTEIAFFNHVSERDRIFCRTDIEKAVFKETFCNNVIECDSPGVDQEKRCREEKEEICARFNAKGWDEVKEGKGDEEVDEHAFEERSEIDKRIACSGEIVQTGYEKPDRPETGDDNEWELV